MQKIYDKGPFRVVESQPNDTRLGNIYLESDDFKHDVILNINGDFADLEQKRQYAEGICDLLNAAIQIRQTWEN